MAKYTTTVSDQEILDHFRDVLAPYVIKHQTPQTAESFLSPRTWSSHGTGETVVNEIENILLKATDGETQQKVITVCIVIKHKNQVQ